MIGHHTPTHTPKTHGNQMRPMSGCVHTINVKVFHVCTQSMMTQADVITLHELHRALKEILCVSWHLIDQSTNQFVKNIADKVSYTTITHQLEQVLYIHKHGQWNIKKSPCRQNVWQQPHTCRGAHFQIHKHNQTHIVGSIECNACISMQDQTSQRVGFYRDQ